MVSIQVIMCFSSFLWMGVCEIDNYKGTLLLYVILIRCYSDSPFLMTDGGYFDCAIFSCVLLDGGELFVSTGHFVVVCGYDTVKDYIFYRNPCATDSKSTEILMDCYVYTGVL